MSKKSLGLVLLAVAFFGFVITVSAAATTAILDYNASVQLTENNLDSSFLTRIDAKSLNKDTTIQTKVGRKMFNLIWHDSGTTSHTFTSVGESVSTRWSANGTYDTRATFKNTTSGSSFKGNFGLA